MMSIKFFHYLLENHPGEGIIQRTSEKTVALALPSCVFGEKRYDLPIDYRDQRVLVVVDGELLWDSIPKAGDVIWSINRGEWTTNIEHLRKPRFGTPSYSVEMRREKWVARFDLVRHFLLLPAGNFVFRRCRDKRSLGPMYVFAEVRKSDNGPSVFWRNSTY